MDEEHREDPRFLHTLAELWHQTDEVPLTDQTRGQRKAIKERRKAREKAQKHQNRKSDASRGRGTVRAGEGFDQRLFLQHDVAGFG